MNDLKNATNEWKRTAQLNIAGSIPRLQGIVSTDNPPIDHQITLELNMHAMISRCLL
jgi:hypothetical protein